MCINTRIFFFFFSCHSSAPVRVEHEGGAAAWLEGTLAVPTVQGHRLFLWCYGLGLPWWLRW